MHGKGNLIALIVVTIVTLGALGWIVRDITRPASHSKAVAAKHPRDSVDNVVEGSTSSQQRDVAAPATLPSSSADATSTAATATPDSGALRGMTIGVDAGHNGQNGSHATEINRMVDAGTLRKACDTTGTTSLAGTTESSYNLDVARRVQHLLQRRGATVVMTRTTDTDWGPCIDERARLTARAEVAVSIHADGNLKPGARGFHVIVPARVAGLTDEIAAPSRLLGEAIRDALQSGTTIPPSNYLGSAGIDERSDLGGLNLSPIPKVLVETGNMKSALDEQTLESSAGRQRIAQAIVNGIAQWAANRQ